MPRISNFSFCAQDTFDQGYALAKDLPSNCCVLLTGPLGSGKTQFIKGLCAFFKINPLEVQSPTYALYHEYEKELSIHHFDLYRLNNTQEFLARGFLDILHSEDPIFIEWPAKIESQVFAHKTCIYVNFTILDDNQREISVIYG